MSLYPKLLVIVPGFGMPHIETKWGILRENLKSLEVHFDVNMRVFGYDNEIDIPEDISRDPRIMVHGRLQGVIQDFLIDHAQPATTQPYDYVMLLLDDVIVPDARHWPGLLAAMERHQLDIVSPSLRLPSMTFWPHMVHDPRQGNALRVTLMCELFCYLMTPAAYAKYHTLLSHKNPWGWGTDFVLPYAGLRCGVANVATMDHVFYRPSADDATDTRFRDSVAYLADLGFTWDFLRSRELVREIIPVDV